MNFVKTEALIILLIAGDIHCAKPIVDFSISNKKIFNAENDSPKKTCKMVQSQTSENSNKLGLRDEVICPQEDNGGTLFPDPSNCNQFWQCSNGYKYLMKCSPHLWFNSDLDICDYVWNHPLKQGCADARCPVGSTDRLPLSGDCTKYIECDGGMAYVLSCCPHKQNANCSNCYFDDVNKQCVANYYRRTTE